MGSLGRMDLAFCSGECIDLGSEGVAGPNFSSHFSTSIRKRERTCQVALKIVSASPRIIETISKELSDLTFNGTGKTKGEGKSSSFSPVALQAELAAVCFNNTTADVQAKPCRRTPAKAPPLSSCFRLSWAIRRRASHGGKGAEARKQFCLPFLRDARPSISDPYFHTRRLIEVWIRNGLGFKAYRIAFGGITKCIAQ